MTRLSLLLLLVAASNAAYADGNFSRGCESQKVFWDSDGKSPYQNHAECVGSLMAAPSSSSQVVQALITYEAGGVGFATFQCNDGVWTIENSHFGNYEQSSGYCAD